MLEQVVAAILTCNTEGRMFFSLNCNRGFRIIMRFLLSVQAHLILLKHFPEDWSPFNTGETAVFSLSGED